MSGRKLNLIGQRFGKLVVIDRAEDKIIPNKQHLSQWICNCDCGNKNIIALGSSLTSGNTKSCGCLKKERAAQRCKEWNEAHNKKYNKYNLNGEYGIGYTLKGEKFFFDLEDFEKIKDICWYKNQQGYIKGRLLDDNKSRMISMHQLIMNWNKDSEFIVDHIHSDYKNDNRKSNLRLISSNDNAKNHKICSNNTSGVTGVSWHKRLNKWMSYIGLEGKLVHLGYFNDKEEAIKVRKEAEQKYYGEYLYNNTLTLNPKDLNGDKIRISTFYMSGLVLTLEGR